MNNQQAIELLQDIVRIDTVAGNEKEVTDLISNLFKEHGISSEVLEYSPGRHNLIVEIKGNQAGDKILGLSGHTDVVPVGDVKWERDPFSGDEADGRIYGRGSADMKSGVAALVAAILRLKEKGFPFAGKIKLLLSVGEETSALGSGQLTAEGYADDLDAMLIAESTANNVLHAHKGAFWLRFTTFGQTGHGSMPQAGVNAVEHMLKLMNRFNETFDFSESKDDLLGESTASLDVFNGGHGTNVIPDKCVAEIDIRTVPGQDHELILARVQEMLVQLSEEIPSFSGEVEVINNLAPVHTPVDDPVITLLSDLIKKTTDEEAVVTILSGYTDAAQYVKADKDFPIVIYGPGDTSQAHQPNESTDISKYLESIEVFEEFIQSYLK